MMIPARSRLDRASQLSYLACRHRGITPGGYQRAAL
jgi:hypothetical protein